MVAVTAAPGTDMLLRRAARIAGGGPIVRRVMQEAGAFGIDVHVIGRREVPPAGASEPSTAKEP